MDAYTFPQLEQLWIANGGSQTAAPVMAAIALAESGGRPDALNNDAATGDYSVGLWQINYFGSLGPARTKAYGTPANLAGDPNGQAKAAIAISGNGSNLKPWTTWPNPAQKILAANGGSLGTIPALPVLASDVKATAASTSVPSGTSADEGYLFDIHITGTSTDLKLQNSTARKIVGAAVLVGGGVVALAGVFVLVGAGKKLPGPVGADQGALQSRREGRQEEAMVTGRAQGRQRRAVQETEDRRRAANRREAEEAVAERQRQNRDAQRQEDALQRIEARRLASASNVRRATPGAGRERTAPRRGRPQGSGKGNF